MSHRRVTVNVLVNAFAFLSLVTSTLGSPGVILDGPSLCRNLPGDPLFPTEAQWAEFNKTIDGRLLTVVPSAKFCHERQGGRCSEDMWTSTDFRTTVPGAMVNYNWEQNYLSIPPSLCLQNGTTCGQGNVPVFGVNATEASHIQAGVKFAVAHNLKVAIKASGHDFLGRSTARGSLLLWTHHLQNISFTDDFFVDGKNMGSAMTTGSGVPVNKLYEASKAVGKFFTGASTATAVASGGYVQGAGHSAFAKVFGLAADNVLEFEVVLANGSLVTVNEVENPDLFWAMRGGGAGSWGVIISTTFRTFPTFPAVQHFVSIVTSTNASTGQLAEIHARHIFDLTEPRAGQYFTFFAGTPNTGNLLTLSTFFPNITADEAKAIMKPMLDDARAMNASVSAETLTPGSANDLMFFNDTSFGINDILGSRLIPMDAYRNNVAAIGSGVTELFEKGVVEILGHNLLGGKVAENANVNNAVNPKWRQAQTHFIAATQWPDTLSPPEVEQLKQTMTQVWVPIIENMTNETDSASYSNEADVREPNFQVTFFGVNYPRLKQIKSAYDPQSVFIVPAGVGSEDWDVFGSCRTVI